jgi:MFS family permease
MPPMGTLAAYRRVLGNPRLARLMAGEFISSIGDWLYLVALLIVIYDISRDPVALGIVGAARIVPFLVLAVPAGIAADRFDRRRILIATDVVRAVLQVVLAGLVLAGSPTMAIVAVAILAACASSFFGPAIGSYLPSLVDDERDLGPANSVWATLDNLAFFVGPAVAGLLIATGGLAVAFLLNAISFAFCAAILVTLPSRRPGEGLSEAVETGGDGEGASGGASRGWRSILGRIPGVVALDGATSFIGAALGVLTVVIAYDALGAGEAGTGYLNAATGIGGILAGFIAGWFVLRRLDLPIAGASLVMIASIAVLAVTRDLLVALLAIGVACGALLILDVVNATVLQRAVPDAERGRAMGVLQISSSLAMIVGAFVGPVAAQAIGLEVALIGGAVVAGIVAIGSIALLRSSGALQPPPVADRPAEILRGSVFASLPPARLEAAARALVPVVVSAGDIVIREGDEPDRFYFVDRGTFRVTQRGGDGDEGVLRTQGPGDAFGEIGLLRGIPRTATVTAETDGALFALDRDAFLDLASAGPGLSSRLLDLHRGAVAAART